MCLLEHQKVLLSSFCQNPGRGGGGWGVGSCSFRFCVEPCNLHAPVNLANWSFQSHRNQNKKVSLPVFVRNRSIGALPIFPLKTSPPTRDTHLSRTKKVMFKTIKKGNIGTPVHGHPPGKKEMLAEGSMIIARSGTIMATGRKSAFRLSGSSERPA